MTEFIPDGRSRGQCKLWARRNPQAKWQKSRGTAKLILVQRVVSICFKERVKRQCQRQREGVPESAFWLPRPGRHLMGQYLAWTVGSPGAYRALGPNKSGCSHPRTLVWKTRPVRWEPIQQRATGRLEPSKHTSLPEAGGHKKISSSFHSVSGVEPHPSLSLGTSLAQAWVGWSFLIDSNVLYAKHFPGRRGSRSE